MHRAVKFDAGKSPRRSRARQGRADSKQLHAGLPQRASQD